MCSFCHAGKHLVLVTDPEAAGDKYAFDNPCFKGKCIPLTSVPDLGSLLREKFESKEKVITTRVMLPALEMHD
jgi:hypothetical protein